jgi:hypothetical protein
VHVWAWPTSGGEAIFLGAAGCGGERPHVAALLGDRSRYSGFSLALSGLPPGTYVIVAYAHSTSTGAFDQSRTRMVTVSGPLQ